MLSRVARREQGSVMIAVVVVVVSAVAVAAMLQTVHGALRSARVDQNRTNALHVADAGLDQAVYRIDAADLPAVEAGSYVPTLTAGEVSGFEERVTVGTAVFDVAAGRDSPGDASSWTVRSTGTDASGRRRMIVASVRATPLFGQGFFVSKDFSVTGNQTSPTWFRSSQCPTIQTDVQACELDPPIPTRVGANGTISGSAIPLFAERWEGFTMYGRSTQEAANAACAGCPPSQVGFSTNAYVPVVPPVPANAQPCPGGGTIGTAIVQPGDYFCPSLNLTGTIAVGAGGNGTGTVRFWIQSGGGGLSVSGTLNTGNRTSAVQIFMPATASGDAQSGSICDSEIWALLYAPGLSIQCTGSHQPTIYGAIVAHDYGGTGNQFGFHYDADALGVTDGRYVLANWRECPAGPSVC